MKRKIFLALWLLGMLFPLNWLRRESPVVNRYAYKLFHLEVMHIIMHLLLFAGLVILVIKTFQLPMDKKTAILMIAMIVLVGLLQEWLQLQVKARPFGWWEAFDLGVDLVGGALGWGILVIFSRSMNEVKGKQYG